MDSGAHEAGVDRRWIVRRLTLALLLAAVGLSLLLAVPPLRSVIRAISDMRAAWVAAAVALELASCVGFVAVFRLFFRSLPARQAHQLAWTEMGAGALLPGGGVGGLAVGGWLMHLTGMSRRRIIECSSALFFLTTASNAAAVIAAGAFLATGLAAGPGGFLRATLPILASCLAGAVVLALPARARRTAARPAGRAWITDLVEGIRDAEQALRRPNWRLLGAVGYVGFDIAVLASTFAALGDRPPLAPLVLGYNIGYLANLLPVPGGIGVLDAGLIGTLVFYKISATDAAAAVLVYHAIAFWVPALGGLLGLTLLRAGPQTTQA